MAYSINNDTISPRQIGMQLNSTGKNTGAHMPVYRANPEFRFNFQEYTGKSYKHEDLYSLYFEEVQPKAKEPLSQFVNDEDDLGPEVIMNLKWLDAYRYPQQNVYLHQDLVQNLIEHYDWARILANPTE